MKTNKRQLQRIIAESIRKVVNEVSMTGKSGKKYSLHGTDPEAWGIMSQVRPKSSDWVWGQNELQALRDENNWIEMDDKTHPNLRSRNNAKRIDAMCKRIDNASDDIKAAREEKLNKIVNESINRVLKEEEVLEPPFYWAISELRDRGYGPETYSCVEDSATSDDASQESFDTAEEAYEDGLEQLKYYNEGHYALEVYAFTQSGAGDVDYTHYAEINDGKITEM